MFCDSVSNSANRRKLRQSPGIVKESTRVTDDITLNVRNLFGQSPTSFAVGILSLLIGQICSQLPTAAESS